MHKKNAPSVGQVITIRGTLCRIVKIRPFGTLDVVSVNGNVAFRVSGLNF